MSIDSSKHPSAALSRRRFITLVAGTSVALEALLTACSQSASPSPAQPAAGAPTSSAVKPAAGAATAAPQAAPGGFAGGGSLKLLVRSHFVPAYDTWLDKFA